MKKEIRKLLMFVFAGALCTSVLTGCGNNTKVQDDQEEEFTAEYDDEEYVDEYDDESEYEEEYYDEYEDESEYESEYDEESEYDDESVYEDESEYETENDDKSDEPEEDPAGDRAETDQVLMSGYYGFWNGDTKYVFGVLSDKDFIINVVGATSPILYAEGQYIDNGDGTYTATITDTDNDYAKNQTIKILAEGGPDISMSSENTELNEAVAGKYTFAGESAADVDELK